MKKAERELLELYQRFTGDDKVEDPERVAAILDVIRQCRDEDTDRDGAMILEDAGWDVADPDRRGALERIAGGLRAHGLPVDSRRFQLHQAASRAEGAAREIRFGLDLDKAESRLWEAVEYLAAARSNPGDHHERL